MNMNHNRHTRQHNHTRGNRVGIREISGEKKQIIGFNGKGKLVKDQLLDIGKKVIGELENNTLSFKDLRVRIELLIDEGEDI